MTPKERAAVLAEFNKLGVEKIKAAEAAKPVLGDELANKLADLPNFVTVKTSDLDLASNAAKKIKDVVTPSVPLASSVFNKQVEMLRTLYPNKKFHRRGK
jgi:hypothetical protein